MNDDDELPRQLREVIEENLRDGLIMITGYDADDSPIYELTDAGKKYVIKMMCSIRS